MSHPLPVSDLLSNHNDNFATAAKLLGRSKVRIAVFEAIYKGKKEIKTITELMNILGYSRKHILTEGRKLAGLLVEKVPNGYKKIEQFAPGYKQIINLSKNPKKLKALPTKVSSQVGRHDISIKFPKIAKNAIFLSIDDVTSFSKAHKCTTPSKTAGMREERIKKLFQSILNEHGQFKDWGGEKSDLFSTRLKIKSKRVRCAIAFKGRGTRGKLVPGKMGKNGDQIGRLFDEPADVYLVVYNGQIEPTIIAQMQAFAIAKAIGGQKIYFGTIDEVDLGRLVNAYK